MTSALSLCPDLIFSSRAETQLRELDVTRLQWLRGREELRAAIRDKENQKEGETVYRIERIIKFNIYNLKLVNSVPFQKGKHSILL